MRKETSFDVYDTMPKEMRAYLSNYGFNFNKKACDFAVSLMKDKNGKITPIPKEKFDELMTKYGIKLENDNGYNGVYALNMAKADFYGSSIQNEQQLAIFVKDWIDDVDGSTEKSFRYFFAMCMANGIVIDWVSIL